MKAVVNTNAAGTWRDREGEPVEVVGYKPNGRAAEVRVAGAAKTVYLPARWLDVEPERCPACGQVLP